MKKQPGERSEGSSSDDGKPELGSKVAAAINLEMLREWGVVDDDLSIMYRRLATQPLRKLRPDEIVEKLKQNQDLLAKINEIRDQYKERGQAILERHNRIETATSADWHGLAETGIISRDLEAAIDELSKNIDNLLSQEDQLNDEGRALLDEFVQARTKIILGLEDKLAEIKQNATEDRDREIKELDAQFDATARPFREEAGKAMAYPEVFNAVYQEALIFQERAAVEQGDPEYRLGFSAMEAMADRQKNAIAEIERVTGLTGVREMMIQAGRNGGQAIAELRRRLAQATAERTDEVVPEKVNPIIAPKNSYIKRRAGLVANEAPLKSGLERVAALGDERAKGQLVMLGETKLLDGVFKSISSWIDDIATRRGFVKVAKKRQTEIEQKSRAEEERRAMAEQELEAKRKRQNEAVQKRRKELQKFDHGGPSKLKDESGKESTATVFKGAPDQAAIDALIKAKGSGVAGRGNGTGEKAVVKGEKTKNERRTQIDARLEQRIGDLIRKGTDGRLAARVEVPPLRDRQDKIIGGHYGAVLVEPTLRGDKWEVLETVATGEYVRPGEILTTAMLIERLREFRTLVPKEEAGE